MFVTWSAALALAGCHAPVAAPVRPAPPPVELPTAGRTAVEPDISAVSSEAPAPVPRPAEYRQLTAAECRQLAIANAPLADDLDQHSDNEPPSHPHLRKKAAGYADASSRVRGHAADELRNRAAGEALDEFFKLANAEGQYDLLLAADAELRGQLAQAIKAEQGGLKDRADTSNIRQKLLDIEAQRGKLEAAIDSLNASLRVRLGLAVNDPLPLWPADPLHVKAEDVDVEQAVVTGLYYRPDLNLLRVLAEGSAGELASAILKSLNPLLASTKANNPLAALLAPILAPLTKQPEREKAAATARVIGVLRARERQADGEIRAAVATLLGDRAAVAARALDVKRIEAKVADLQIRQKAGLNVTAELVAARLALLKAKGDLLTAVTDWHSAEVKLRQAMGLLVRE